jgi:hypothetical protein
MTKFASHHKSMSREPASEQPEILKRILMWLLLLLLILAPPVIAVLLFTYL